VTPANPFQMANLGIDFDDNKGRPLVDGNMHKRKKQNTWFIVSTIASPAELLRPSLVILSYINTNNGKGDFFEAKLKKDYPFHKLLVILLE
jgi:hypothetical protein